MRYAVSQRFPVYILDLNRVLLDQMIAAPHSLQPDILTNTKPVPKPNWQIVSEKQMLGSGANRMELYPLRGASTERQYMVYFPEFRLLYASDTLAMNDDGTLYDPELMYEVVQAVKRENLKIDTVFAMHQGPMPWAQSSRVGRKGTSEAIKRSGNTLTARTANSQEEENLAFSGQNCSAATTQPDPTKPLPLTISPQDHFIPIFEKFSFLTR